MFFSYGNFFPKSVKNIQEAFGLPSQKEINNLNAFHFEKMKNLQAEVKKVREEQMESLRSQKDDGELDNSKVLSSLQDKLLEYEEMEKRIKEQKQNSDRNKEVALKAKEVLRKLKEEEDELKEKGLNSLDILIRKEEEAIRKEDQEERSESKKKEGENTVNSWRTII